MGDIPITKCPPAYAEGYIPSANWSKENGEETLSDILMRLELFVNSVNGGFIKK